jgi:hypothetical protein
MKIHQAGQYQQSSRLDYLWLDKILRVDQMATADAKVGLSTRWQGYLFDEYISH